jgi:hypothetical protein
MLAASSSTAVTMCRFNRYARRCRRPAGVDSGDLHERAMPKSEVAGVNVIAHGYKVQRMVFVEGAPTTKKLFDMYPSYSFLGLRYSCCSIDHRYRADAVSISVMAKCF